MLTEGGATYVTTACDQVTLIMSSATLRASADSPQPAAGSTLSLQSCNLQPEREPTISDPVEVFSLLAASASSTAMYNCVIRLTCEARADALCPAVCQRVSACGSGVLFLHECCKRVAHCAWVLQEIEALRWLNIARSRIKQPLFAVGSWVVSPIGCADRDCWPAFAGTVSLR
jgi:hypothetical protein